jgi:hypothetical protein
MRASQRSRAKYPLATISACGPDNRRATKLVVGILHRAGQKDPNPMRSWSADAGVVAADHRVQIAKLLAQPRPITQCDERDHDWQIARTAPACEFIAEERGKA